MKIDLEGFDNRMAFPFPNRVIKQKMGRVKDLRDIKLISQYQKNRSWKQWMEQM